LIVWQWICAGKEERGKLLDGGWGGVAPLCRLGRGCRCQWGAGVDWNLKDVCLTLSGIICLDWDYRHLALSYIHFVLWSHVAVSSAVHIKVKPSISVKISNCSYLETRFLLTKNKRRK
jgi:hypothetical protein